MKFFSLLLMGLFLLNVDGAWAGEAFEYKAGDATMEGYLAMPSTKRLNNPAVLIVHNWMGLSDDTRKKADQMAEMGYIALAVDIYGKGVRPKTPKEAGALAGRYKGDVTLLRARMQAAFDALKNRPDVDPTKILAFGYCFGGTAVLELARTGTPLVGAVSFHGGLATPKPADAKKIKAPVLILHGAIDPHVPEKEVLEFQKAMNKAGAEYQFISYSGAVHAFTEPSAGDDPRKGAAYNKKADERSWKAFLQFLSEVSPI